MSEEERLSELKRLSELNVHLMLQLREAVEERDRLRVVVVAQQAAMDQFMARIQHALKELESDE